MLHHSMMTVLSYNNNKLLVFYTASGSKQLDHSDCNMAHQLLCVLISQVQDFFQTEGITSKMVILSIEHFKLPLLALGKGI